MKDTETIEIDGIHYLSSAKAAKLVGYTKDYVGQLARAGKLKAKLLGRNWYIAEDSIKEHRQSVHYTLTKPKKKHSESVKAVPAEKATQNIDYSARPYSLTRGSAGTTPANIRTGYGGVYAERELLRADIRYEGGESLEYGDAGYVPQLNRPASDTLYEGNPIACDSQEVEERGFTRHTAELSIRDTPTATGHLYTGEGGIDTTGKGYRRGEYGVGRPERVTNREDAEQGAFSARPIRMMRGIEEGEDMLSKGTHTYTERTVSLRRTGGVSTRDRDMRTTQSNENTKQYNITSRRDIDNNSRLVTNALRHGTKGGEHATQLSRRGIDGVAVEERFANIPRNASRPDVSTRHTQSSVSTDRGRAISQERVYQDTHHEELSGRVVSPPSKLVPLLMALGAFIAFSVWYYVMRM